MKADWERYQSVVKRGKDGNPLNDLKIDSCNLTDEKNMCIHLQGLAQRTDTHGHYQRIGEVYGFPISIISERTLVDGKESVQNRLVVERNYKYKYNNGYIAMSDTHAACMNFVNALEKTPGIIAQYEERTAKLKANVPQLEAIISKTWGNENELKQLKSELAPTHEVPGDRKGVNHDENYGSEVKQEQSQHTSESKNANIEPTQHTQNQKPSMVAEPMIRYREVNSREKSESSNFRKYYKL